VAKKENTDKTEQSTTEPTKPEIKLIIVKNNITTTARNPIMAPILPLSPIAIDSPKLVKNVSRKPPYNAPNRQTAVRNHCLGANMRDVVIIGEISDQA